jgi:hypothetical protein
VHDIRVIYSQGLLRSLPTTTLAWPAYILVSAGVVAHRRPPNWCLSCSRSCKMRHMAFDYEVTRTAQPNEWLWIVYTPEPRHGIVTGSRGKAVVAARSAIEIYCRQYPVRCQSAARQLSS